MTRVCMCIPVARFSYSKKKKGRESKILSLAGVRYDRPASVALKNRSPSEAATRPQEVEGMQ